MTSGIESERARIESALNSATLRILDRKSAGVAMPVIADAFPDGAQPILVERFTRLRRHCSPN